MVQYHMTNPTVRRIMSTHTRLRKVTPHCSLAVRFHVRDTMGDAIVSRIALPVRHLHSTLMAGNASAWNNLVYVRGLEWYKTA